jgi:hypothetical protein
MSIDKKREIINETKTKHNDPSFFHIFMQKNFFSIFLHPLIPKKKNFLKKNYHNNQDNQMRNYCTNSYKSRNQKNNEQFQISQTQIRFTQINNKLRIQTILWDLRGGIFGGTFQLVYVEVQ